MDLSKQLSNENFIELDRRFTPLGRGARSEDVALESYTRSLLGQDPGLGWNEIIQNRLVVVLGEPGSGKTWEFRRRSELVSASGAFAFFVRLDQIASQPPETALQSEDVERFQRWIRSNQQAVFFLAGC